MAGAIPPRAASRSKQTRGRWTAQHGHITEQVEQVIHVSYQLDRSQDESDS